MVPKWPAQSALPRPGLHKASGNTTSAPRLPRGTGRGHGDTAGSPAAVVDPRTLPIEDGYMTGSWRHWRTRGGGRRPEVPGAAANVPASTSKLLFFSAGDAIPPLHSRLLGPVAGSWRTHDPLARRASPFPCAKGCLVVPPGQAVTLWRANLPLSRFRQHFYHFLAGFPSPSFPPQPSRGPPFHPDPIDGIGTSVPLVAFSLAVDNRMLLRP